MSQKSQVFTENSFLLSEVIRIQNYITTGLRVAFRTVTPEPDLCPESLCPSCVSRCPAETGPHSAVCYEEVLERNEKTMGQKGTADLLSPTCRRVLGVLGGHCRPTASGSDSCGSGQAGKSLL